MYPKARLEALTDDIFAVDDAARSGTPRPEQAMPDTAVLFQAVETRRHRA
jgi:hypothetical protein